MLASSANCTKIKRLKLTTSSTVYICDNLGWVQDVQEGQEIELLPLRGVRVLQAEHVEEQSSLLWGFWDGPMSDLLVSAQILHQVLLCSPLRPPDPPSLHAGAQEYKLPRMWDGHAENVGKPKQINWLNDRKHQRESASRADRQESGHLVQLMSGQDQRRSFPFLRH